MTVKDGGIAEPNKIQECVSELDSELESIKKTIVKATKAFATRLGNGSEADASYLSDIFGQTLEHSGNAMRELISAKNLLDGLDTLPDFYHYIRTGEKNDNC